MKRTIILGLGIFLLLFVLGVVYIIYSIERSTSSLDELIVLHQVEILREHLLIQVKRVQSDLSLKNTRYARGVDVVVKDVGNLQRVADACLSCHHNETVTGKINGIRGLIEEYKSSLSRAFTIRANVTRLDDEEDAAFSIGQELINKVDDMVALTTRRLEQRTQATLTKISATKIILYVLLILGPLLIFGLSYFFIRTFTRPMNKLLYATRRLKEGDLDYRIEGLKQEFGEVAGSINEMAGSLKEHFTKMQRIEQGMILAEVAAGLAHEIKNPLAGVRGAIELISQESNMAQQDRELLLKAVEDVIRIESLMKDLLSFAKPPKPQYVDVDLNGVLDMIVSFALKHPSFSLRNGSGIKVVKDFDEHIPAVPADPMQLRQIFLNLLLNAAEAMPDGGSLQVKTYYEKSTRTIGVRVSDTGKGIDADCMNKIFQPFFTTKRKGTGLGLAIIKRLIEQHEGAIGVENNPEGGATFTVSFPETRNGA
ncbi:putative Histidine kinase [Candidatus Sulfobium mesophilum]|uniref:histidine kinase n=1 Tax=Candidatus Sulfobium mesophilum TaxID=2016548 RepID=A0A2U3QER8_9BACT|nr:putative Histidine kinase [Candidatus Sulfobium mesophilum]